MSLLQLLHLFPVISDVLDTSSVLSVIVCHFVHLDVETLTCQSIPDPLFIHYKNNAYFLAVMTKCTKVCQDCCWFRSKSGDLYRLGVMQKVCHSSMIKCTEGPSVKYDYFIWVTIKKIDENGKLCHSQISIIYI